MAMNKLLLIWGFRLVSDRIKSIQISEGPPCTLLKKKNVNY